MSDRCDSDSVCIRSGNFKSSGGGGTTTGDGGFVTDIDSVSTLAGISGDLFRSLSFDRDRDVVSDKAIVSANDSFFSPLKSKFAPILLVSTPLLNGPPLLLIDKLLLLNNLLIAGTDNGTGTVGTDNKEDDESFDRLDGRSGMSEDADRFSNFSTKSLVLLWDLRSSDS